MCVVQVMGMNSKKYGGIERFLVKVAARLKKEGIQLIIIYESRPRSEEYIKNLVENDVELVIMPAKNNTIMFLYRFYKLLRKTKPRAVHCHFGPANVLALFMAYIAGVENRFLTFHSLITVNNKIIKDKEDISKRVFYLQKIKLYFASHVIAVSQSIVKQLSNIFRKNEKISCLYIGVEGSYEVKINYREKYNLPLDTNIITCIAFNDPIKGVDILLKAIPIISEKYCFDNFIVCFIGIDEEEGVKIIQSIGGVFKIDKSKVKWLGIQDNVMELLSISDIYCQPSRAEGIALANMEACMAQLPIVATKIGGIPEVVEDGYNGLLVEPNNPEALAESLNKLLNSPRLRAEFGKKALAKAELNFDVTKNVDKMLMKYYLNV